MSAVLAFLLRHWKPLAGILAPCLLYLAWQADRAMQYRQGVSDTKAAYEAQISQSEDLIDDEKDAARDAASRAAHRVCIDRGIDPEACANL